jgi:hypothetical protein
MLGLLIHSGIYYSASGIDRNGKPTFETLSMSKVRFSARQGVAIDTTGKTAADAVILYISPEHSVLLNDKSAPVILTPTLKDKVTFDGREYFVVDIVPAYANELHHWELVLK